MTSRIGRSQLFSVLVVLTSSFFLLTDLSDFHLWQDEADAAVLGRNILTFGVPQAFDGQNYVAPFPSDVREDHVWRVWGWIPLYVNAATYWAAGPNTLAARLPYATLGIGFFLFFYRSLRKRHRDSFIPEVAVVLGIFCIPILLHFRQCQYYAPIIFLTWILFLLAETDLSKRRARWGLVLASFVLFNCHVLAWAIAMFNCAALRGYRLWRSGRLRWEGVSAFAWAGLAVLPTALIYRPWELAGEYVDSSGAPFIEGFWSQLEVISGYIIDPAVPSLLLAALAIGYVAVGRTSLDDTTRARLAGAAFFSSAYIVIAFAMTVGVYRYYIGAIAIMLYAVAIISEGLWRRSRVLGTLVLAILLVTNVAGVRLNSKGRFVSQLAKFWSELTTDDTDVNELLIEHLRENAKPGDTVLISYGGYPIVYYTGLSVGGGPSGYRMSAVPFPEQAPAIRDPDWVIIRKPWVVNKRELSEILATGNYRMTRLEGVDTMWGNRPSPHDHHFRTPRRGPPLEIFERVRDTP